MRYEGHLETSKKQKKISQSFYISPLVGSKDNFKKNPFPRYLSDILRMFIRHSPSILQQYTQAHIGRLLDIQFHAKKEVT